jgi:hypothetical protein
LVAPAVRLDYVPPEQHEAANYAQT